MLFFSEAAPEDKCFVSLKNVYIRGNRSGDNTIRVYRNATLKAETCVFQDLSILANGDAVELKRSVITGAEPTFIQIFPDTRWGANENVYLLKHIRLGDDFYSLDRGNLEEYKTKAGDDNSIWIEGEEK
jgi:hypothetical protein